MDTRSGSASRRSQEVQGWQIRPTDNNLAGGVNGTARSAIAKTQAAASQVHSDSSRELAFGKQGQNSLQGKGGEQQ